MPEKNESSRSTVKQTTRSAEKSLDKSPAKQRDESSRTAPMPDANDQPDIPANPNRIGSPVDDRSIDQAVASGDIKTPQYQRDHA